MAAVRATATGRRHPVPAGRTPPELPRSAWAVLAVVFVATVLLSLNGTMLNIALPAVVHDLDASAAEASWILLGYMLVNTSLMVLMGQVADSTDRRRMFLTGLLLYTGTAAGLGLAPSAGVFLALRLVQGLAAAVLLANAAAIIAAVFPSRFLNQAMGIYLSGFAIAQVAGPSVGGLITAWAGWRWLFWATVPIGLLALAGGWRVLRTVPVQAAPAGRVDVLSNAVLFVGMTGLLLGLSATNQRGWADPVVIGGIAAFVVLLPVLVLISRRVRRPAIDLTLFRSRDFTLSLVAGFLLAMPRLSVMAVAGLYFQGLHGDTPLEAALKVTPLAVALTLGSLLADPLTRWVEERLLMVLAAAFSLAGMLALVAAVAVGGITGWFVAALAVIGLGNGILHPINSSIVLRSAPHGQAGSVNAVRVMAQSGGMTLSTAVALSLVVSGASAQTAELFFSGEAAALTTAQFDELTGGYVVAFGVLTGMLLVGLLCGVGLLAARRLPGTTAAPVPALAPSGPA